MLTIFSVPKPFSGRTALLQRNALSSWRALDGCQIVLLGGEQGVSEAAEEAEADTVADVARTSAGTPRVDAVFAAAEGIRRLDTLCFVNADVLLPPSLLAAVGAVASRFSPFLVVGQCHDVDVDSELTWSTEVERAALAAPLRGPGGIDFLVFPSGLFASMPSFALGRAFFDNWLLWDARRRGVATVDVTAVVPALHQRHDYGHVSGGKAEAYEGVEARRNLELAGGRLHLFNIDDSTHRLTPHGIRRNLLAPLRALPPARLAALEVGRLARLARG